MISLIYQHYGPFDQLVDCIENLADRIKSGVLYSISIVVDDYISESGKTLLTNKLNKVSCKWNLRFLGGHIGITKARNISANISISEFHPDKLIFCCTNSKFIVDLDKTLHNDLLKTSDLTIIPFICNDWLYKRNFVCQKFDKLPVDYFLSVQNKPDYLMMVSSKSYESSSEFNGEEYTPEDVMWFNWAKDGIVTIYNKELQRCWFNENGLTKTGLKNWRKVEIDNSQGFYEKAETFIDEFLKGNIVLNIRQLKDYCSTLVSNHKYPIPLKKYKGTIIEALLIERLKSWSQDLNHINNFKIYEEFKK